MWLVVFILLDKKGVNLSITCNDLSEYPEAINCTFDTHAMSYPKSIIKSYKLC